MLCCYYTPLPSPYPSTQDPRHPVFKDRIFVGGVYATSASGENNEVTVSLAALEEVGLTQRPQRPVVQGVEIQGRCKSDFV
ncbi:hypothetical protein EON63_16310 [archaeon]|nr:MAG: hypothetical protein EON63_16310 [archaeon]